MVPALTLWLPILLSAVFVFIASMLVHMVFKYHGSDYKGLPSEDGILDDLAKYDLEPGEYYMPFTTDFKDRENPEYMAKVEKGPVGFVTITGPDCSMGKPLAMWFVYSLLVGFFTAYVCGIAMGPGAGFMEVFRMAGTVTFAGYFLALIQNSIWYKRAWSTTLKYLLDGFIYGCVTAATFAWLWPQAVS
jgi:hypothetical protein